MDKLLKYIKTNYRSLTASFFLAVLLWFAVTTDSEYTYTMTVPLVIETLGENLVLQEKPPKSVKIKIKGSGRSLFSLNFFDQKLSLNLADVAEDGVVHLTEYKNSLQIPQDLGIDVVDVISPKTLHLKIDQFVEKKIPLRIDEEIKTIPGYMLVDYLLDSDSVLISGPKSLVESLPYIFTEKISRDDVRFPFEETINLKSPKPGIINLNPQSIDIQFNVEQLVERTLYNIPIRILNVPGDISAEATPVSISLRVKGGESMISGLSNDDINVLFDFAVNFKSGKSRYPMQIDTPENVTWIEASPQTFNLKLIRKEETL